jgi:hypothetical protein
LVVEAYPSRVASPPTTKSSTTLSWFFCLLSDFAQTEHKLAPLLVLPWTNRVTPFFNSDRPCGTCVELSSYFVLPFAWKFGVQPLPVYTYCLASGCWFWADLWWFLSLVHWYKWGKGFVPITWLDFEMARAAILICLGVGLVRLVLFCNLIYAPWYTSTNWYQ